MLTRKASASSQENAGNTGKSLFLTWNFIAWFCPGDYANYHNNRGVYGRHEFRKRFTGNFVRAQ